MKCKKPIFVEGEDVFDRDSGTYDIKSYECSRVKNHRGEHTHIIKIIGSVNK